jgi:hypothetical protein
MFLTSHLILISCLVEFVFMWIAEVLQCLARRVQVVMQNSFVRSNLKCRAVCAARDTAMFQLATSVRLLLCGDLLTAGDRILDPVNGGRIEGLTLHHTACGLDVHFSKPLSTINMISTCSRSAVYLLASFRPHKQPERPSKSSRR